MHFPTRANLSRSTPRLCTSTGTLFFPTHVHRICSGVAALRRAIVQRTQILKNFRSSCRESMDTVSSCRKHRPRQHYRPRLRTHASATDHPMPMACTLDAAISPIGHAQRPLPASQTSVDGHLVMSASDVPLFPRPSLANGTERRPQRETER